MGTNFYDAKGNHIGKRSAAGLYCWDCEITLCKLGKEWIHHDFDWYKICPECGKGYNQESLLDSSAGRELGFNKNEPRRKQGVATCASFTWSRSINNIKYPVTDEYGSSYTRDQFLKIVNEECPIHFTHMMGKEFC